jgi:nucleoside-diphosphate-sugar epimerase
LSRDGQTVVVTGAAGFIGGRVAQLFAEQGRTVVAVDLPARPCAHLASSGIEIRPADITDYEGMARALGSLRPAAVVHCAALMGGWGAADEYRRINVEGTRNVATWAASAGAARLIYISSVSVYGMPAARGIDETTPFKHIGLPYGDSKMEAEQIVRRFHTAGLASTILRPGDVYGPRAGEWVVKLVDSMKSGRMILIGGGRGLINTTYVDNLVDAIVAALERPEAAGRDYIITDGAPVTWKEYLGALAEAAGCAPPRLSLPAPIAWPAVLVLEGAGRLTGRRPPLSRMGLRLLTAGCTYSIARARRELDWSPRVGFEAGMKAVGEWLRARRSTC